MLERYGHGGDWLTARELYGANGVDGADGADRGPQHFVDFSANMNPFGPPSCVFQLLQSYGEAIVRYPDPAVRGLKGKLAARHKVDPASLLIGNGAAELIDLLLRVLRPEVTVLAEPCFSEYREAAAKSGSAIHVLELQAEQSFRLTLHAVQEKLAQLRDSGVQGGRRLWFLGSPNNPTGQVVDKAVVEELLASGETVALDEAFMDFAANEEELSMLQEAAHHERLIVIRSMTKFYAIPGIRLGYMAAHPTLISQAAALQVPWSVNSLAQAIGEAVLEDAPYAARTVAWLQGERRWMIAELEALGLVVYGSAAVNYLLAAIPEGLGWTSDRLQETLGREGILIRDASHFIGLDRSYIRFAVRLRPDNELLLLKLRELLKQGRQV